MKWEIVPRDEQETIINIDYCEKIIKVYTTRKSVADRLLKKVGKPTKIYESDNRVYAVVYEKNLFDKDVAKFFSKMLMVGAFRDENGIEKEEED